ncbi:MAG: hypothetical protein Q9P01_02845 [Anaerolineae bacterium]|nr:hypothetical protein [Anaerolineae bacterium]
MMPKTHDEVLRETPEKWATYVEAAIPVADFVINIETNDLPPNASMTERQAAAQRILPILAASENNLYKKDNLQKLAMRLHISESDLLAWAQEIQRIAARKPRRSAPQDNMPPPPDDSYFGSMDEPPPNFDFDDEGLPPEYYEGTYIPPVEKQPTSPSTAQLPTFATRNSSRATEAYCLGMLLNKPTLLAQINRKFRELAQNNTKLLQGPLSELNSEDFSQGDYRALLSELQSAMSQDDVDPMDYLREELDEMLVDEMTILLLEEPQAIHRHMGMRHSAEFEDVWKNFERRVRPSIDTQVDFIRRALKVRHQRLEREQQEIRFLLEDAQRTHDREAEYLYCKQTEPGLRALLLIQRELGQRTLL